MYRKFVIEGEKMTAELINLAPADVTEIYGTERWAAENSDILKPLLDKFNTITEAELKKISTHNTPNSVLAVVNFPEKNAEVRLGYAFYLDGIQDPGNLGAILRVADWFGIDAVFTSPDTVDIYNPKTIQAGMGAVLRVSTLEISINELLALYPGTPVIGAVMQGESLYTAEIPPAGLLVIGNEGRGIRPETEALLTRRVSIPRGPEGGAESLNAGVAAGIFAAFIRRVTPK